jgi:hypothetical protein
VWPYYVGATHVTTLGNAEVGNPPTSSPTSTEDYGYRFPGNPNRDEARGIGGVHAPAIGDSTNDQADGKRRFQLTLETKATSQAAARGLRIVLKRLLRSYGLRCVSAREIE